MCNKTFKEGQEEKINAIIDKYLDYVEFSTTHSCFHRQIADILPLGQLASALVDLLEHTIVTSKKGDKLSDDEIRMAAKFKLAAIANERFDTHDDIENN